MRGREAMAREEGRTSKKSRANRARTRLLLLSLSRDRRVCAQASDGVVRVAARCCACGECRCGAPRCLLECRGFAGCVFCRLCARGALAWYGAARGDAARSLALSQAVARWRLANTGMGDTCCFPFSMGHIKKLIEKQLPGIYVYSVMVGNDIIEDEINGFLGDVRQLDASRATRLHATRLIASRSRSRSLGLACACRSTTKYNRLPASSPPTRTSREASAPSASRRAGSSCARTSSASTRRRSTTS